MPPGRTVTNAAAMVVDTVKFVLSAIRSSPAADCLAGTDDPSEKMNGCGGLVPVQLPDAARGQAHVPSRDRLGDLEIGLRHLTRPAAVLNPLRRVIEGSPVHRHTADVGCRRKLSRWKFVTQRRILRPG